MYITQHDLELYTDLFMLILCYGKLTADGFLCMRFCEFRYIPHNRDSKISEGRLWQRSDDITYPTSLTCSLTRSTKQGTSMFQPITAIHSPTLSPTTNRTSQPTISN